MPLSSSSHNLQITSAVLLSTLVLLIAFTGCGLQRAPQAKRQLQSSNQMKALLLGIRMFRDANNDEWPETLDQVRGLGDVNDLEELMHNPVTGYKPGYEYVKPPLDADPKTTVILFQLRDGQRDASLRVGFGDGRVAEFSSQE